MLRGSAVRGAVVGCASSSWLEVEVRVGRTAVRVNDVLDERVLVHAIDATGITKCLQAQVLILLALSDAVINEQNLIPDSERGTVTSDNALDGLKRHARTYFAVRVANTL